MNLNYEFINANPKQTIKIYIQYEYFINYNINFYLIFY